MKRFLLIAFLLLLGGTIQAKPARTGIIRYRQPDGTILSLRLHGDAFGHYATDASGNVLELDAQGFYRQSALPEAVLQRRMRQARRNRVSAENLPTIGEARYPVVLIAFQDVPFSGEETLDYFQAFFNQEGFSEYGGTGSIRDYYRDNSLGLYSPSFDVYGPVTIPGNRADYGRDIVSAGERICDAAPQKALYQACRLLDQEVDFARYDADGDGVVDRILYIYAGYDQAEGAPSDAIWAHSWDMASSDDPEVRDAAFDGVKLGEYLCTSELMGNEGAAIQGIGPTCHEFAHALGLPDFYDTDGLVNGLAGGLYQFSLMCDGLYNNDSRTPPYLNALERCLLGWMEEDAIPELPEGKVKLGPVQQNQAYRSFTATEGEYYLYETRTGTGWDAALPAGLLVYHVDRSQRKRAGIPALELWDNWPAYNNLNNYLSHPCFYLIPSGDLQSRNTPSAINPEAILFPGIASVRCYEPQDWDQAYTGVQISAIGRDPEGNSSFRVLLREDSNISGEIRNPEGKPLSLAFISEVGNESVTDQVFTDQDGFFLLPLEDGPLPRTVSLNVTLPGYRSRQVDVELKNGRTAFQDVVLPAVQEPFATPLQRYDPSLTSGYFPTEGPVLCGVLFPVADLAPYVGMRICQVACHPLIYAPEYVGPMWVTVDFGTERVLSFPVEDPPLGEFARIQVDISEADLRIPEGLPVYIGYGFEKAEYNAPAGVVYPGEAGNSYWSPFSLEKSDWKEMYSKASGMYMNLMLSSLVKEVPAETLDGMGFSYIDPGQGSYKAGERFPLKVVLASPVKAISWRLDGLSIPDEDLLLPEGDHALEALLQYKDGRKEKIKLEFTAK